MNKALPSTLRALIGQPLTEERLSEILEEGKRLAISNVTRYLDKRIHHYRIEPQKQEKSPVRVLYSLKDNLTKG